MANVIKCYNFVLDYYIHLQKFLEELINLEPHAITFQMYFTPNGLKTLHDAITLVVIITKFAQVNILAKLFSP